MSSRFTAKFWFLSASIVLLAGSGCVSPQQVELLDRDQRRLRTDVNALRGDVGTMQADIDSARASLADTRANLQQMQRDISAIRERIDETRVQVGRQIGQTSRDGDQRVKSFEARLLKLEEDAKAQAELLKNREAEIQQLKEAAQTAQASGPDGYAEAALGESDGARRDFESGWRLFERKEYRSAVSRFKEFLKKYPKSRIAANAQYWLGESHFGVKEYDKAIVEFDEVRRRYPQSDKVPAALLRQGFAFAELGEKLNARLVLQDVVEKYPQSVESLKAKQKLKSLES